MLQGIRTVIYKVGDLDKAKEWFAQVLGRNPYFDQPFYVGFNVGGYELGLDPDTKGDKTPGPGLGVDDAKAAVKRLVELGASVVVDVKDVGEGIKVATIKAPSGHQIGIIENPHFKHEG